MPQSNHTKPHHLPKLYQPAPNRVIRSSIAISHRAAQAAPFAQAVPNRAIHQAVPNRAMPFKLYETMPCRPNPKVVSIRTKTPRLRQSAPSRPSCAVPAAKSAFLYSRFSYSGFLFGLIVPISCSVFRLQARSNFASHTAKIRGQPALTGCRCSVSPRRATLCFRRAGSSASAASASLIFPRPFRFPRLIFSCAGAVSAAHGRSATNILCKTIDLLPVGWYDLNNMIILCCTLRGSWR